MSQLLEFLPVSTNATLKTNQDKIKFLQTYHYFVKYIIDSFCCFISGELQQFDAHVGDTACQIRGYYFYLKYQTLPVEALKNEVIALNKLLIDINNYLAIFEKAHNNKEFIPIAPFIKNLKLDIYIDNDYEPFFFAFFLNNFANLDKISKASIGIDYKKIVESIPHFSNKQAQVIVKSFQKKLAELSCQFIKDIACEIALFKNENQGIIDLLIEKDSISRPVIPAFLSGLIIIEHIIQYKHYIHLEIELPDPIEILMQGNPEKNCLEAISYPLQQNTYLKILVKVSKDATHFDVYHFLENTTFRDMILCAFASHPQYACKSLHSLSINIFKQPSQFSNLYSQIIKKIISLFDHFIRLHGTLSQYTKKIDYCIYHIYSGKLF